VVESHARFFPGIPIVFCGSIKELAHYPKPESDFTGVWMVPEAAKTLDAALQLRPGTKHVVVVGGAAEEDRLHAAFVRKHLRSYEARMTPHPALPRPRDRRPLPTREGKKDLQTPPLSHGERVVALGDRVRGLLLAVSARNSIQKVKYKLVAY
jgi:hypothetical protein